ncbi:N-formylglutamate deformylase [Lysobacter solisilvae (ex Woo and Kim 2020)]|uniref:N-formylglutamate deformylase n=1 Tax=Agrilutibacter terrestris TaxID=2865112 RepID=A0A7H0FVG7_9GAMM|nr:N-formylglutamate deformylase [Lysobacter terrestris]QNP40033.1 N-formylglutamate deformylase [Lysobacter terrestris]
MTPIFELHRGTAPLLVSLPHNGSEIPAPLRERMVERARLAPDTDWHVARLYAFARELGASVLVPSHSRYVIDLNRPSDDTSLYPGQNTTGLCPVVQFTGAPVYLDGQAPSPDEIAARIATYWQPYHAALQEELARIHAAHGHALLWEGHSIKGSELEFLFPGRLPDFNLGTSAGASCSPQRQARVEAALAAQSRYDFVVNGRFKGGYITRHYADPARGIDAIQLEISQRIYMDEATFAYDEAKAVDARAVIRSLLEAAL